MTDSNVATLPLAEQPKTCTRTFQKTDLDALNRLQAIMDIDDRDTGPVIGYSRAAVPGWREDGEMPVVASMACQLLIERHYAKAEADAIVIARIPADKQTVILTLLDSMGVSYYQA